ncbi:MAG: anti-sigma factor family protein [Planctomycetota bacterium]|jgi:hypothetical protein
MDCTQAAERITALVDDELTAEERAGLESHLADCAVCREALEEERAVTERLRATSEVPLPEGFKASVMDAVRSAPAPGTATGGRLIPMSTWIAAAAAAAAAIVAMVWVPKDTPLHRIGVDNVASAPAETAADAGAGAAASVDDGLRDTESRFARFKESEGIEPESETLARLRAKTDGPRDEPVPATEPVKKSTRAKDKADGAQWDGKKKQPEKSEGGAAASEESKVARGDDVDGPPAASKKAPATAGYGGRGKVPSAGGKDAGDSEREFPPPTSPAPDPVDREELEVGRTGGDRDMRPADRERPEEARSDVGLLSKGKSILDGKTLPTVVLHLEFAKPGAEFRDAIREVERLLKDQRALVRQKVWTTDSELDQYAAAGRRKRAAKSGDLRASRNLDDLKAKKSGEPEADADEAVARDAATGLASRMEMTDDGPVAILRIKASDLARLRRALTRSRDLKETHAEVTFGGGFTSPPSGGGGGGGEPASKPRSAAAPAPGGESAPEREPGVPVPPKRLSPDQVRKIAEGPPELPKDVLLLDSRAEEVEVRIRLRRK